MPGSTEGSRRLLSPPQSQLLSPEMSLFCNHRIIESLRLEKTSKIIKSKHQPNTTMPTKMVTFSHFPMVGEHFHLGQALKTPRKQQKPKSFCG